MKNFIAIVFCLAIFGTILDGCNGSGSRSGGSDVDKIIKAKSIVRSQVNYPDTLDFHDFSTKVSGSQVTLKFTAKNGFGVPSTHTMVIDVD